MGQGALGRPGLHRRRARASDYMVKDTHLTAILQQMQAVRRFPQNTCPASRHVQILAEALAEDVEYPMLQEDPHHIADSIASVVTSLYVARDFLDQLGYSWSIGEDGAIIWEKKKDQDGSL